jgi:hypothetical protein
MSPTETGGGASSAAVAAAIDPYRTRLADDAMDFTLALLALAKFNAANSGSFNQTSAQDKAVLKALADWRRDAQHALRKVRTVDSGAPGRNLAERWLKALIASLDSRRQALSLLDPDLAADAASSAAERTKQYLRLEGRLDRTLA